MSDVLGTLFGTAAALRVAAYRRGLLHTARLAGPVVSVGNLSVGGSGKTPVVRRVAELLLADGERVAILSRGYRGSFRGDALVVSDGKSVLASSELAGDEAVMLARSLAGVVVAVGSRRDLVGRAVERRFGPRVFVLDDGFQHLRLARDLDVVCLDVRDLADRPLPLGRLRESPAALARAQVLLLTRLEAASEPELDALEERLGRERVHRVERRIVGIHDLEGRTVAPPPRAFLLAAVARPERFERDVARAGSSVVGRAFFRDHQRLRADELQAVLDGARRTGADAIVTTAKDAVRLPATPSGLPLLVLEIAAEIQDEARFRERLRAAIARRAA